MQPETRSNLIDLAKLGVVVWGLYSFVQGLALDFLVNGADQYTQSHFIELTYCTVLIAGLISFFSSRLASFLLSAVTATTFAILFKTSAFEHGNVVRDSLIRAILLRPGLSTVILFLLSVAEKRVAVSEVPE